MARNLWKVDRRRGFEEIDSGRGFSDRREAETLTVGATLRRRREERGEDLQYIAQLLRIRHPYLKAIEDGRIADLPGPTYAVGFLRTYADHLGLDSKTLINRFKAEIDGLNTRTDLHFPSPLPEGKIPSGAVMLIALVLAASIYGGWMYLSSEERPVAEIVPQLPSRISEIIRSGEPDTLAVGSGLADRSTAGSSVPSPYEPLPDSGAASLRPAEPTEPPIAGTGAPLEPVESRRTEAEKKLVESALLSPRTETVPSPAPEGSPALAGQGSSASAPRDNATVPAPPGVLSGGESQIASVTGARSGTTGTLSVREGEETAARTGRIYGQDNTNARVVLEAVSDSWVEVRDRHTDELLLTRVLFKGDRYLVPNRSGLALLTGNAGGLRITVDGTEAPSLGREGAVRRNVPLDPGQLLSGMSGNNATSGESGNAPASR